MFDQPLAVGDHADIGGDETGSAAQSPNLRDGFARIIVIVPAVDDQIGALLGQAHGNAPADALGAARNQRNLVL